MADLDYAYLADFAAVQDGKLSAIGASFTHVRAGSLPGVLPVSVAGRIRTKVGESPVAVGIHVIPPNDAYDMEFAGMITAGDAVRPYGEGKLGLLFALNAQVALESEGLYVIEVTIEGKVVRRLAFDVEIATVS